MKQYLNGLFLIRKPSGITSHDVVAKLRRILSIKQVGHTGTLDPLAEGLMGVLVGEATKVSNFLRDESKSYRLELQLGLTTDTEDITGEVLENKDAGRITEEVLKSQILDLEGEMTIPVPKYSAIKRDGQKLYEKARAGVEFEPPLKLMGFSNIKIENVDLPKAQVSFNCTKGSYVRSWITELGRHLEVGATMTALERTRIFNYHLEEAIQLEDLESLKEGFHELKQAYLNQPESFYTQKMDLVKKLGLSFYELSQLFPHWKSIMIQGRDEKLLKNGMVSHELNRRLIFEQKKAQKTGEIQDIKVLSSSSGQLLSILEARPDSPLKIKRVFN